MSSPRFDSSTNPDRDWAALKERDDPSARERLAERYLPLVKQVIDRLAYNLPGHLDKEDLISEGILGLIEAIDRYDPARLNKFETYAVMRIRGAVLDSLRQLDWAPRSLRQKGKEIEKAFCEVERRLGRAARDAEVAEALGITVEDLNETLSSVSCAVIISFEEMLQLSDDDQALSFMSRVADSTADDPGDRILKADLRDILVRACGRLPENEKTVIGLYYIENMTLKMIGGIMNITESRVSQLHTKALLRLRSFLMSLGRDVVAE